jgi:AcrR family transcriptional regulator
MPPAACERLLQAGVDLFAQKGPAALYDGMTVSSLARRARTTRATFYHHWPTLDAYFVDLVRHVFKAGRRLPPEPVRYAEFLDSTKSRTEAVRAGGATLLQTVIEDQAFPLRMCISVTATESNAHDVLEGYRTQHDEPGRESTTFLWDLWRRVPREPFDHQSVAVIWTAMLDGLALRQRLDPDLDAPALFGNLAVALLPALSRDIDDPMDLDQWAAPLEQISPGAAPAARTRSAPPAGVTREQVARAVLQAAFDLLEDLPWGEVTVRQLADRAQVSELAVLDAFGSKAGVAALVLSQLTYRRAAGLAPAADPLDELRQILQSMRAVMRQNRAMSRATLMYVTENAPGPHAETVADLPFAFHRIADGIRRAQEAGELRTDVAADPLALHWARSILLEQVATGVEGVEGFDLVDVLINGVQVTAPT